MPLSFIFFAIALFYSIVGFGGGSSYIAFLALFDVPYTELPKIALICNLIVVSGGSLLFVKSGHFRKNLFWPFACTSVPFAFLGGIIPISEEVFYILLGLTLLFAGGRILLKRQRGPADYEGKPLSFKKGAVVGAGIGFLSGLVGIGGGIFLSPLLLNLRWGNSKNIAATASLFILFNSIAGLLGQLTKANVNVSLMSYWPLFLAVFCGGQIGSRLGAKRLSPLWVSSITALLVIFVGGKLLWGTFR